METSLEYPGQPPFRTWVQIVRGLVPTPSRRGPGLDQPILGDLLRAADIVAAHGRGDAVQLAAALVHVAAETGHSLYDVCGALIRAGYAPSRTGYDRDGTRALELVCWAVGQEQEGRLAGMFLATGRAA